jgi:aspartyl-tRNA(Asn)/glutamyl-tRNA(Gln) amidotransferase subunit B
MYQPVIGLEIHAELFSDTKIFCGCSTKFGQEPNSQTCPVCLGLPGVLPVLNQKAVELLVKIGLALGCKILPRARFDRKNYYYPDLPKNYQISQNYLPFAVDGSLELPTGKGKDIPVKVGIDNVHLEEDAGKNIHIEDDKGGYSLVDFNRAGIPLAEIVTRPDMHSLEDVMSFMTSLRDILLYLRASNCKMEEGALRFEANVSIRPYGESRLGARVEIKNLNSFKSVLRALQYEIERQGKLLESGEIVRGETRLWDEKGGKTLRMRLKESSPDYRYFPEPDLPPVVVEPQWIEQLKAEMPELPVERQRRFTKEYNIPHYDAVILTSSKSLADFYEEAVEGFPNGKEVSNWIMGEVLEKLKEKGIGIEESSLTPQSLSELLNFIKCDIISGKMAREVFSEMFATGKGAREIVEEKGLKQISDTTEIKKTIDLILKKNPDAISDFRAGKKKAIAYLIGQIMKETRGAANPQLVDELLRKALEASEELFMPLE